MSQIRIRVGEYDFASAMEPYPYVERGAKRKVVHPQYNFFTYENDLALVQVDEPFDFQPHVSPICLPPDNIELVGRNATVTGWGRLSEGQSLLSQSCLHDSRLNLTDNRWNPPLRPPGGQSSYCLQRQMQRDVPFGWKA